MILRSDHSERLTSAGSGPRGGERRLSDTRRLLRTFECVRAMDPSQWRDVTAGAVLHLRERVGQTLGVAVVAERVRIPQDAPLRLEAVRLPPGAAWLCSPKLAE